LPSAPTPLHDVPMHVTSPQLVRRLVVGALVVGGSLGLAACSSSSSTSTTTTTAASGSGTTATTSGGTATTKAAGGASTTAVSCGLAPAAQVGAALGITVGDAASEVNGPVTVCTYQQTGGAGQVIVRFQTGMTPASFSANESQFTANGETTTPVTGLGDQAYSSTIGGGGAAPEVNTIVVLKGSNEVLITGPASQAQVQSLATQLLPKL